MIRVLACFVLVALTCAEEAQPSTLESTFVGLFGSAQSLATEEHFQRRFADITLGLQVAQGFAAHGAAEIQKFHQQHADSTSAFFLEEEKSVQSKKHFKQLEEDDDDVKALEEAGADEFLELKEEHVDLATQSTHAKISALKSLHLQLYLTASDVEKSYWMSKIFALVLPPQYASLKLYKTYLNTMALSIAYQFHDAFTFETSIEAFNNDFEAAAITEALAEHTVYQNWYNLVSIKWQLFMLSIYEQSYATAPQANHAASSFLETEEQAEFVGGAGQNPMMAQYAYLAYYIMMLKYYSIFTELNLAQTGLATSQLKVQLTQSDSSNDAAEKQLNQLEGQTLPQLYVQWTSINQQKYMLEYYTLMFDMQSPAYAASQDVQRAENSFINLFQAQKAETTAPSS